MNDYLRWQLMQPAATTALLQEFLSWLTVWLLGVSVIMFVICLVCLALKYRGAVRAKQRAVPLVGLAELQPSTEAVSSSC
ncbi:MAG: hypothetical protein ACKVZH_24535 [Blastocatellia bacterium]